jgi:hypothetical protein
MIDRLSYLRFAGEKNVGGVCVGLFQNLIFRNGFINFLVNRAFELIQEKTWENGLH